MTNKRLLSAIFLFILFFSFQCEIKSQELKIQTEVFSNGMKVVYIPDKSNNQTELFLFAKSQKLIEKKKGLSEITANVLLEGIIGKSPQEWNDQLKKRQIEIDFSDEIFTLKFNNQNMDEAILWFSNLFQKNAFYNDRFDQSKLDLLNNNIFLKDSLILITDNLSKKIAYGYPHPLSFEIKESEINQITIKDCQTFLKAAYIPQNLVLVVYGNFDKKLIEAELSKRFGAWKNEQDLILPNIKTALAPAPNNYFMTPILKGDSSLITINYPLDLISKEEYFLPCKLLENIIKKKLSEIEGMGQILEVKLNPRRFEGLFEIQFFVSNLLVPSVLKMVEESLSNIYWIEISEQELNNAQNTLIENSLFPNSKVMEIREILRETEGNFGKSFYGNNQIKSVTLEQVNLMKSKFLKPKNLNVIITGDLNFYYNEILDRGKCKIVNENGHYLKWIPEEDKINTFLQNNVLENYLQKIGGLEKIKSCNKVMISYSGDYLGKQVVFKQIFFNNQFSFDWTVNGELIQRQVFNGQQFISFSFGERETLDSNSVKDILALAPMIPELYFAKNGIKLSNTKIVNRNNMEEIELQLKMPSGKIINQYYSKTTGLKTATVMPTKDYFGLSNQVYNYAEYQNFNGINLPRLISIKNENLKCTLYLENFETDFFIPPGIFAIQEN